ncbi:hypothetical protein NF681_11245 [Comamonadaceae bacterium OTU4NAUVB1]|nr:hypothetical protein NF681_11245 [Comamonadaceae bacterium OTU4NAUVB1]
MDPVERARWMEGLMPRFQYMTTAQDFEGFAAEHEEPEIRAAFEQRAFMQAAETSARAWLIRFDRQEAAAAESRALEDTRRTIAATERSARWALLAAIASAVSALAAAATVAIPLLIKS